VLQSQSVRWPSVFPATRQRPEQDRISSTTIFSIVVVSVTPRACFRPGAITWRVLLKATSAKPPGLAGFSGEGDGDETNDFFQKKLYAKRFFQID
jgi:hypothetical protein